MKEAFSYMFKDNMYKQKALTYCLFAFIANFLVQWGLLYAPTVRGELAPAQYHILVLLGYIVLFIPQGYSISCIKALLEQKDNYVLPFLNIKNNFILGFKFFVNVILISLAAALIFILLCIPFVILYAIGLRFLVIILSFLLIAFAIVLIIFYSPVFCCIFAKKEWFTTYFRFIRATKIIRKDFGHYFKYLATFVVMSIAITAIIGFGLTLLINFGIFGAALKAAIIALISAYTVFLFAYITAKSVKAESIE